MTFRPWKRSGLKYTQNASYLPRPRGLARVGHSCGGARHGPCQQWALKRSASAATAAELYEQVGGPGGHSAAADAVCANAREGQHNPCRQRDGRRSLLSAYCGVLNG